MLRIRMLKRSKLQNNVWHNCINRPIGRNLFWGSNNDGDNTKNNSKVSIDSTENDIALPYGQSAPKLSPLLLVPTMKMPMFPNSYGALVIKNPKIAEQIIANKSVGQPYFGVSLRKDWAEMTALESQRIGLNHDDTGIGSHDINNNNDDGSGSSSSGFDPHHPEIITSIDQLHTVGTMVQVQEIGPNLSGGAVFGCFGIRRININYISDYGPPSIADVTHWSAPSPVLVQTPAVKAYVNELMTLMQDLFKSAPLYRDQLMVMAKSGGSTNLNDPYRLADFVAQITTSEPGARQEVLEAEDIETRLALALDLLQKEMEIVKIQSEINKQVEETMSKQQREYMLREQMKSIKRELGIEKDDKEALLIKYKDRLSKIKPLLLSTSSSSSSSSSSPTSSSGEEALSAIESEIDKLESLEKNSSEFNVTRAYLDWLTILPWGKYTKESFDIASARNILDNDHFGLEEIKKRILEFIAVGKLRGSVVGKILCFIGPPGVGKTSIATSIATALDRKFYRFSVGGLSDVSEIKGHRRTYIGAMPGKPIQALKSTNSANPLILIDEIDKLGRGYQGDPASALLELLDPSQNHTFMDHYLDIPIDFSNVLFVCTANDEGGIPGALRDRMEIVRLSGYDIPEKVKISKRYLVPKALNEAGLSVNTSTCMSTSTSSSSDSDGEGRGNTDVDTVSSSDSSSSSSCNHHMVDFTEDALERLVKDYCRESGVRSLQKSIERICRRIALEYVESSSNNNNDKNIIPSNDSDDNYHVTVNEEDLEKYLGKPRFGGETIYEASSNDMIPGVVMGLAWSPLGGGPCYIEAVGIPHTKTSNTYTSNDHDTPENSSKDKLANKDLDKPSSSQPLPPAMGVNIITGQLGNVMKESVSIASTFTRRFLSKNQPNNVYFNTHTTHLHVPEGAVEKDGPSAGVAMTCSLISLATSTGVQPGVAMTGELSLTGKVLPVGGIKEKVLAARRAGAHTVILPVGNRPDFEELPEYVKECVSVTFAQTFEDAFNVAFPHGISGNEH